MPAPYDIFDDQFTLFDGEQYWRIAEDASPEEREQSEPELPDVQQQLGWDRVDRGNIAHIEFEALMVRLGAAVSRPNSDPGGGTATDTYVTFRGRTVTVQVKSALIKGDGRAKFGDLGSRDGSQAAGRDTRRRARYIGRADFFALAVFNEGLFVMWYLIPAAKLRGHVTLTVRPGERITRKRKNGLYPERYRDAWYLLLDVPSSALQDTWVTSSALQDTQTNA